MLEVEKIAMGTVVQVKDSLSLVIEPKDKKHKATIKQKIKYLNIPHDNMVFLEKIPRDPSHNSKIDYDLLKSQI